MSPKSPLALLTASRYSVYVLLLFLLTYLLNQLDRYALGVTSQPMAQEIHFGDKGCMIKNDTYKQFKKFCRYELGSTSDLERSENRCLDKTKGNVSVCRFDYDGTGQEYQILAGPAFIVVFTIVGVPLGLVGNFVPRKYVLGICLIIWSVVTILTGAAKTYWQLVVTRFLVGIGEAGCTPFATSLIGDFFEEDLRGAALGVYNWGIYFGYSMSYALGNYVTQLNINNQGWRWVFYIAGMPGILIGLLILFTVREPKKKKTVYERKECVEKPSLGLTATIVLLLKTFARPSLILLFIAGSVRNAGGYVWAYNTQLYFNLYYPDVDVGAYMSWIPLVGGSFGVVLGGFISDRIVVRKGPYARVWVLVFSQIIAAPFSAGALFLEPPWAFISLIPSNIVGEMWIGVTLAVVIELVPSIVRTASIAWYLFVITIIGGNVPLLVPILARMTSRRTALYILYPGLYAASSILFFFALFVLKWDLASKKKAEESQGIVNVFPTSTGSERDPLLANDKSA